MSKAVGNTNYDVLVINWRDYANGATLIDDFLSWHRTGKTLFVLSHVSAHNIIWDNGTVMTEEQKNQARAMFNTLQSWGTRHNIVFLWGHDHRNAAYDKNIEVLATPNGKLWTGPGSVDNPWVIPDVVTQQLTFTYLNAGYINPVGMGGSAAATVITFDSGTLAINRWYGKALQKSAKVSLHPVVP